MDGDHSLYDTDFLTWTEEQATALRALAGRRDLPNGLDLANVIEEIETLGRSELKAATSPIRLILGHLVKAAMQPDSPALNHWKVEIAAWHGDAREEVLPSMHRKIDMDEIWRRAVREARVTLDRDGVVLPPVAAACPLPLDAFIGTEFDFDAGLAAAAAAVTPP